MNQCSLDSNAATVTREDADDAVAYAWVVDAQQKHKRETEDADDAVAYAWVVEG